MSICGSKLLDAGERKKNDNKNETLVVIWHISLLAIQVTFLSDV